MKEIDKLIERYWDGTLSPEEKQQLLDGYPLFLKETSEASAVTNRQDPYFLEQWNKIATATATHDEQATAIPDRLKIRTRVWYAAACTLVLISCAWLLLHRSHPAPTNQRSAPAEDLTITYANNKTTAIDTLLPDGSNVHLYPGSTLQFPKGFSTTKRDIRMTGRIVFDVHRDALRPFTVYAGNFSTTALATKFEINTTLSDSFTVRLINGKVVVRTIAAHTAPMADVYLLPGERLTYDLRSATSIVLRTETDNQKKKAPFVHQDQPVELSFSNLPLNIVFRQLEQEFKIGIWCDEQLASDRQFSGTFLKKDGPEKILNQIAKAHHLHVTREGDLFRIE